MPNPVYTYILRYMNCKHILLARFLSELDLIDFVNKEVLLFNPNFSIHYYSLYTNVSKY